MAGDESRMAGGESRMAGGEPRMTADCCRPEGSIHRCVRTYSHLYSYIYSLVALLNNIQSSFSSITISTFSPCQFPNILPIVCNISYHEFEAGMQ